jgi:cell cycle sensor histidine kinase DivJ
VAGEGANAASPWTTALFVAVPFAFGHVLSLLFTDRRMQGLVRAAARAGETCEATAIHAIDDLVTWHDAQGAVLRATNACSTLLGMPPSCLLGSGLFTRVHVGDRPAYLKALSDAVHSRRAVTAQIRVKTGEGALLLAVTERAVREARPTFVWVEMHAQAFHAPSEERSAVVAVLRDISAMKRDMEALNEARREAVQANADRTQLLATVSHELRTPLNAILGYAELMSGKGMMLSPEQRMGYAQTIHQSGQHMLEVVSTLLDLATIESGHYKMAFERVDMASLARECCAVLALPAERAGVTLRQDFAEDLAVLHADRRACRQILLNLLSNAVKFTPEGGQVVVRLRRQGDAIAILVQDTGIGVSKTDLPRLGLPFYRGAATGRAAKGNGLGLSVVRGLVDLHGGRFRIASAPGAGTSVNVLLPLSPGREAKAEDSSVHDLVPGIDHTIVSQPSIRSSISKAG